MASGQSAGTVWFWSLFGSSAVEGYWARLIVGPSLTGLGRRCFGCRPVRLDCGSGLRLVQLNIWLLGLIEVWVTVVGLG